MRALQLEVCCSVCVFIQCLFAWVHGYSHAYLSVCESLCLQLFPPSYFDVLLDLVASCWVLLFLNLKNWRGFVSLTLSLLCASDKKRFLCIIERLTTLSLPRPIKSSRCCFWGSYLLNPLHRNVLVGGGVHQKIWFNGPAANYKCLPVFISDIYLISRIFCSFKQAFSTFPIIPLVMLIEPFQQSI